MSTEVRQQFFRFRHESHGRAESLVFDKYGSIQKCKHLNMEACKHRSIQTQKHSDTEACKHRSIQRWKMAEFDLVKTQMVSSGSLRAN